MKTYYKVSVTCTGKSYKANEEYHVFDHFEKCFTTVDDARAYLIERYGPCKRVKMYHDNLDGKSIQTGWVYCFNNSDWSHAPVEKWRQQDWVEVTHVTEEPVL